LQSFDFLTDPNEFEFFLVKNLVDVQHGDLQDGWDAGRIQEPRPITPGKSEATGKKRAKKVAPFLGPLFKEAERREVREDFARCRSDKQTGHSGVVENYELW
jgi:hypothetical protein